MSEIRENIRGVNDGSPTPAEALQAIARLKAREVGAQWESFAGKNMKGAASFQTRYGAAQIGAIEVRTNDEGLDAVEVWTGPRQGAPAYRLINPPMMVADSNGPEMLTEYDPVRQKNIIKRFRVDPLQAIAEVIASRNGSEQG